MIKNKYLNNVKIIDIGTKKKCIAKNDDNKVIFLNEGVPGDNVNIKILKKYKGSAEGKIISYNKHSRDKITPKCNYFGICGGCNFQDISYLKQIKLKEKKVLKVFKDLNVSKESLNKIIPSKKEYFYRNKLEFSFSNNRWISLEEIKSEKKLNKNALGFHKPGKWDKVVDIYNCHLQSKLSNKIKNLVRNYCLDKKLEFFDHREKKGFLRNLTIKTSLDNEVMLLFQFYKRSKEISGLLKYVQNNFPKVKSIVYIINKKHNDSIYDQKIIKFYGRDFINEKIGDLNFKIKAKTFYQTNSLQAKKMYKIISNWTKIKNQEVVLDLYTGIGTIALSISKNSKKIIGVDIVEDSIKIAKENSKNNNIKNVSFIHGDVKNVLDEIIIKYGKPSIIILDPPRNGVEKIIIDKLLKILPEKLIYISCNIMTQYRDIKLIKDFYEIRKIQPIDMFPQTHHIENIVLLEKILK